MPRSPVAARESPAVDNAPPRAPKARDEGEGRRRGTSATRARETWEKREHAASHCRVRVRLAAARDRDRADSEPDPDSDPEPGGGGNRFAGPQRRSVQRLLPVRLRRGGRGE